MDEEQSWLRDLQAYIMQAEGGGVSTDESAATANPSPEKQIHKRTIDSDSNSNKVASGSSSNKGELIEFFQGLLLAKQM